MRAKISFNENWLFSKEANTFENSKKATYEEVTLPHTWNAQDGQDGGGDYYRGTCGYKKTFEITSDELKEELYIEFEAVMSIADVFINGEKAFHHEGGFSTFRVHLNKYLHEGQNEILVLADNDVNKKVYPQFADFTFFGGIYRDVSFISVPHTHFDLDYYGTKSIAITPRLEDGKWTVDAKSFATNFKDGDEIRYELISGKGTVLQEIVSKNIDEIVTFEIKRPHLWNGRKDPYLYEISATLTTKEGDIDHTSDHFGLRTFRVDPETGFYLNGEPYHLHGVSRHQDRLDKGWALSKKEHDEDMELIKEVGATTIRLAHYQHAQYFYDLCDKNGLVIWAEIPYISSHMDTGKENVFSQMTELVLQNYNHPSIVCWGLSNEITMRGTTERLVNDHKELNDYVKKLDDTRLTTIAEVSMTKMDSPMCQITDIISYNHYFGWYAGTVDQNGPWLDKFHELYPKIPLGLSEYGCEAILDWHSEEPKQGDYTEEYQAYYHEEMLKTFATRPYLWSTHVWNMFDFAADNRDEGGKKGRNHKGLVTFDRKTKKDSFFIYKAYWNDEDKFIHICSKRYEERSLENIKIKVYTNLDEVTLTQDGKEIGTKKVEDHKVIFDVTLHEGKNEFVASNGNFNDNATFIKVEKENEKYHLKDTTDVINWFDKDGNPVDFNFIDGYLNIDSPIKDINSTPLGKAIMNVVTKFGMKKMGMDSEGSNDGLLEMMGSMSIRRISKLAGGKSITPEFLYAVNEILNKIPLNAEEPVKIAKTIQLPYINGNIAIDTFDGYYSLNDKIKDLLKSTFVKDVINSLLVLKPGLRKNLKGFKFFLVKRMRIVKLLKLTKKVDESLAIDINNILGNIKK